jgi:hypothetical protein
MSFICLSIFKKKKKENSFAFLRLHPKQPIEPLVTPPATPLSFAPPRRPQSSASGADPIVLKFTERLELPSSFHKTTVSELDRAHILRPLSLHPVEGSGAGSSEGVGIERKEVGVHSYVPTSACGGIDGSHREGYNDKECEKTRMNGAFLNQTAMK